MTFGQSTNDVLFVGGLSADIDDKDIRNLFSSFNIGTQRITINFDRNGRSRGFAFVDVENREDFERALQIMDGELIKGRPVAVREKVTGHVGRDARREVPMDRRDSGRREEYDDRDGGRYRGGGRSRSRGNNSGRGDYRSRRRSRSRRHHGRDDSRRGRGRRSRRPRDSRSRGGRADGRSDGRSGRQDESRRRRKGSVSKSRSRGIMEPASPFAGNRNKRHGSYSRERSR